VLVGSALGRAALCGRGAGGPGPALGNSVLGSCVGKDDAARRIVWCTDRPSIRAEDEQSQST